MLTRELPRARWLTGASGIADPLSLRPGSFIRFLAEHASVLVLDGEAPDIGAAELAMSRAWWTVHRSAPGDTSSFDAVRFNEGFARATRALDRAGAHPRVPLDGPTDRLTRPARS